MQFTLLGPDSLRGFSPKIWSKVPVESFEYDKAKGWRFRDDFRNFVDDSWALENLNSGTGTIASIALSGGAVRITGTNSTTNHGGQAQPNNETATFIIDGYSDIYFEAICRITGSTLPDYFMGLSKANTVVLGATGDYSSTSNESVGWNGTGAAAGTVMFDGTDTSTQSSLGTIVTATWFKVGIVIEKARKGTFYFNGEKVGVAETDDFPTGGLVPTFAVVNNNSVAGLLDLWDIQVVQARSVDLN